MHQNIWYYQHPFLPDSDIGHIISASDVLVNLVKHDQLSTSIIEALYLDKELICSDVEPYRILNDKFNLRLNLLKSDPLTVSNEIIRIIKLDKNKPDKGLLAHRKNIVKEHFDIDNNFTKVFEMFYDMFKPKR